MRNLKKILALVLAMVMAFSVMATASAALTDLDSVDDSYDEAVQVLTALGVFNGRTAADGSTYFAPKGTITREEVAAILYRIDTGRVTDEAEMFVEAAKFDDVKSTDWAAGYIGYAANGGLVLGYNGKFNPTNEIDGYQVLAMILRAVGYGKNGEFTGSEWQKNVAACAQELGILDNLNADVVLSQPATREVVAEILFQAVATVKQVEWPPAFGYQVTTIQGTTKVIGEEIFNLKSKTGYITANQATGAKNANNVGVTVIADDYIGTNGVNYGVETGLDKIGHKVKVWYSTKANAGNPVYVLIDKSTSETVLNAASLVSKISSSTYYSNNYGTFAKGTYTPNVSKYVVIDGGKAVISVNQTVSRIFAVNNYAVTPTVTLTQHGTTGFTGNLTQVPYKQSTLTGFDKATMAHEDIVMVTKIANKDIYHLAELNNTVKGVVRFSDNLGNVTLSDGTVLTRSAANVYASAANIVPQATSYSTLTTYTFLLDSDGRYVGSWQTTSDFLFATYAYYMVDNAATAEMSYYVTGVTANGEVVIKEITAADYNNNLITGAIPTLSTSAQAIAQANAVGQDRSMIETSTADVYNVGQCTATHIGDINNGAAVNVLANTIAVGTQSNYFVDENTVFYFISGTAAQPTVETVTGKTALLGAGDVYTLPANSVITTTVLNYSVNTAANYHIDTVLVKAPYAANAAADLYYLSDADKADGIDAGIAPDYITTSTTTLGGVNATLIGVHKNALALTFDTWGATADLAGVTGAGNARFYTHTVDAAGVTTLTQVAPAANSNGTAPILAYYGSHIRAAGTSGLYITNNNGVVENRIAENAIVVDLRPNEVPAADAAQGMVGTSRLAEITDVATLISRAAEYDFVVDAAGTSAGMTIVYIKSATIRALVNNVEFVVMKDGAAITAVPGTHYTILTGVDQSGTDIAYNGTVNFTAAGTVTVAGKTLTASSKWINGQLVNNVYTVSGITAPVTVTITLPGSTLTGAVASVVNKTSSNIIATNVTGYVSFDDAITNATNLAVGEAENLIVTLNADTENAAYANFAVSATPSKTTFEANKTVASLSNAAFEVSIVGQDAENFQNGNTFVVKVHSNTFSPESYYVAFKIVK